MGPSKARQYGGGAKEEEKNRDVTGTCCERNEGGTGHV